MSRRQRACQRSIGPVTWSAFAPAAASRTALGLRLQELAQAGQAAPGCLRYELRQADGDSDLWLLHSEWSDDAAMQAYLAGDAQRVFAEVLWQALAATLDVQERPL